MHLLPQILKIQAFHLKPDSLGIQLLENLWKITVKEIISDCFLQKVIRNYLLVLVSNVFKRTPLHVFWMSFRRNIRFLKQRS